MSHMTWREKRYRRAHLSCARHITLDPKGPGVVRIHMIPAADGKPRGSRFCCCTNGGAARAADAVVGRAAGELHGSARSVLRLRDQRGGLGRDGARRR